MIKKKTMLLGLKAWKNMETFSVEKKKKTVLRCWQRKHYLVKKIPPAVWHLRASWTNWASKLQEAPLEPIYTPFLRVAMEQV